MSQKKHQHIVSKVYLKWFCNEKLLSFYDRKTGRYKEQRPYTTGRIKHFYTIIWKDWEKDFLIEDFFWKEIENSIWDVFSKLNRQEHLEKKEKDSLMWFVIFQYLKTEVFRNKVNKSIKDTMEWQHSIICSNDDYLNEHIKKYENKIWLKFPLTKEEYKNMYKYFNIEPINIISIKKMFKLSEVLYPLFRSQNWFFYVAPKWSSFITSDNPFSIIDIWDESWPFGLWWFLSENLWSYIPLTKSICLHFDWSITEWEWKMVYVNTNKRKMKSYNALIANNSHRYIIWKDKKLIESIVKRIKIKEKSKNETGKIVKTCFYDNK